MTEFVPAKVGGYEYDDGSRYYGDWNEKGQRHGFGHLILPDLTRYDGSFFRGFFSGLGILQYSDGARYEGEFIRGWFHGYGIFYRKDGMKYEGEFRGGKINGHGLITYSNGQHGFPRNEGLFMHCRMVNRRNCRIEVEKAQKCAFMARCQLEERLNKTSSHYNPVFTSE